MSIESILKYTPEFENRYIYLESLLEVYFWVWIYKYINLESPHQVYFWVWKKCINSKTILQTLNVNF